MIDQDRDKRAERDADDAAGDEATDRGVGTAAPSLTGAASVPGSEPGKTDPAPGGSKGAYRPGPGDPGGMGGTQGSGGAPSGPPGGSDRDR